MNDPVYNQYSLDGVCAALSAALGAEPPKEAAPANPALLDLIGRGGPVDRVVMYNPDAVALWLYQKYTSFYRPVQKHTCLTLPLTTVMPSVTPVCFGTMYTGAQPEVHGIRRYEKPVIRIDTLFDALLRAGKKPAIVAEKDCSLSMIFKERDMDYFVLPDVNACNKKTLELIERDEYDFILDYNGNYDAAMHRHAPEGKEALAALQANAAAFDALAEKIKTCWQGKHRTLLGFAPDHGCHEIDGGLGSHSIDMPEDLNILHFYGVL